MAPSPAVAAHRTWPKPPALLDKAAKLGHIAAAYNLALLHLEGQQVRQTLRAPPSCCASPQTPAVPKRNTRSRLSTRMAMAFQGSGAAARLLSTAARGGNIRGEVEYAIALFNGTGIAKDETPPRAVPQSGAKGQCGRAKPPRAHSGDRPRHARRSLRCREWHTIAKAGGTTDVWLEEYMRKIKDAERISAEKGPDKRQDKRNVRFC